MKAIWQCPQCKGNKVTTINENMLCLSCGYQEYLYDYPNALDMGYINKPHQERQTAPSTSQPWDQRQQHQLDQTKAELMHIRQKLFEITGKKLEPGKAQPQPQRTGYKGLVVNE